jgi:hypothetical protein
MPTPTVCDKKHLKCKYLSPSGNCAQEIGWSCLPKITRATKSATPTGQAELPCYNADGTRKHENSGWCEYKGKCKSKHRVWEEGPRGGMRRTDSFMCDDAL